MSHSELLPVFRRILTIAQAITDQSPPALSGKELAFEPLHGEPSTFPPLILPQVSSILRLLKDRGVGDDTANKLSSALDRALDTFRNQVECSFRKAWAQILHTPRHASVVSLEDLHSQLCAAHATLYLRKANKWKDEVEQRVMAQRKPSRELYSNASKAVTTQSSAPVRPSFNNVSGTIYRLFRHLSVYQEYLPILEAFFSEEQFPSRADKLFLAKKSNMTYRQIHVWVRMSNASCIYLSNYKSSSFKTGARGRRSIYLPKHPHNSPGIQISMMISMR